MTTLMYQVRRFYELLNQTEKSHEKINWVYFPYVSDPFDECVRYQFNSYSIHAYIYADVIIEIPPTASAEEASKWAVTLRSSNGTSNQIVVSGW